MNLLALDYDHRIRGYCVTARSTYGWFLDKTTGSEANLEIQRKIIGGSKAYATLREDLKRGCILPPLVLSAKNLDLPPALLKSPDWAPEQEADYLEQLKNQIQDIDPEDIYIIDGLQRTNALRQTKEQLEGDELRRFLNRLIRFELWLDINFGAIAYRMLLLNAGQKPMSMKHQVEVLSMNLREDLSHIKGIEIYTTTDARRRARPGQFQLAKLAQAFQAWLQGTPNIDVSNAIMQQLIAETAIETLGASLIGEREKEEKDSFRDLVTWLVQADCKLEGAMEFFGADTVLQGIAAAVGAAERNPILKPRVRKCLPKLIDEITAAPDSDPLGVTIFQDIRKGFDPKKRNVGVATRELVFHAFSQYFLMDGDTPMIDCWQLAASRA